jgi:hypothetical protein
MPHAKGSPAAAVVLRRMRLRLLFRSLTCPGARSADQFPRREKYDSPWTLGGDRHSFC